jgi:hypothetical protein
MPDVRRLLAAAAMAAISSSALAEEPATMVVNGTTISVGGGVQLLSLPDIDFTFLVKDGDAAVRTLKNSDLDDYGGALVGSIETPFGYWRGTPVAGVLSGFFANVEDTDRTRCRSTGNLECFAENIVDNPNRGDSFGFDDLITNTNRDVDYWGVGAEARFGKAPEPMRDQGGYLFRLAYVGIGADLRGIDQDNRLRLRGDGPDIDYSETLDTTYAGAFLSVGGEYNVLGYLGIGGSWGIRSLLSLRGGVYNASTDYNGRFRVMGDTTRLGLDDDQAAFIGAASFETRKQFGSRTSLSLVTDYEYYSFAPEMRYVNADRNGCADFPGGPTFDCPGTVNRTHISDDDAFEVRTTLRLNIGLGSAALYAAPLK